MPKRGRFDENSENDEFALYPFSNWAPEHLPPAPPPTLPRAPPDPDGTPVILMPLRGLGIHQQDGLKSS